MHRQEIDWQITALLLPPTCLQLKLRFQDLNVSSSLLEIVELENGEIVLRYVEDKGEPLVTIRFSDESRSYVKQSSLDIAKVMIQAGIQAASHLDVVEPEDLETVIAGVGSQKSYILH